MYYILDQTFFNLLTFSANIGPVSYLLYIGVYYYITRRYSNVFHITDLSQKYLSDAYVIYSSTVNKIQYRLIGKLSLEKRMKFFSKNRFHVKDKFIHLLIPSFVLVHMLNVLCSFRVGNMLKSLQSLKDLHTLLHHDKGLYVKEFQRNIAWHILGIYMSACFRGTTRSITFLSNVFETETFPQNTNIYGIQKTPCSSTVEWYSVKLKKNKTDVFLSMKAFRGVQGSISVFIICN